MRNTKAKRVFAGLVGSVLLCTASIPAVYADGAVVLAPETEDGAVILSTGFEDGKDVSEFTGRGGAEVIEAVSGDAHTGDYSMKISGREKSWNGPQLLLDGRCEANKEYIVSAWVKTPWYNDIKLSMEYTDAAGERHFGNLNSAVSQGEWVEIPETKVSFSEDVTNVYVYFECGDTCDISVDDFTLKEAPVIPIEEDIPSLKDVYAGYFKVGTAITPSALSSPSLMNLVDKHFSGSITLGNEMKPDSVLNQSACIAYAEETGDDTNPQISFGAANSVLQYCIKNNIPVRAHTLVWHSQTPDWFFKENYASDGAWVDKETMLKRMENYIKNYFELLEKEYPDLDVYACDVVNEAWTDGGTPRNPGEQGAGGSNNSAWVQVFGDNSFIEPAFEYARKYAPEGCKLYYNDFNEYMPDKTKAIVEMAESLKEKGLIDGIGMQSHLDVRTGSDAFPSASVYKKALDAFSKTGLDIQITELDATVNDNSEAGFEAQAQYYSDIFDAIVEYKDYISAVVIWGLTDDGSWRASKYPLLFNADYTAKPCFYSIVDDVEQLTTQPTTEPETQPETQPETGSETEPPTQSGTDEDNKIWGDADDSGKVNLADAVAIVSFLADQSKYPLSEKGKDLSDVSNRGDGISADDAIAVQRFLLGDISELPDSYLG